jgi:hypothetical protein
MGISLDDSVFDEREQGRAARDSCLGVAGVAFDDLV